MVHWIIDRALGRSEGGYEALVAQLERQNTPYTLVRKPPLADYLVGMPLNDTPEEIRRANDTPITIEVPNPVFVTGTTSMRLVSDKMGWFPGYISAPGQDELLAHWGDHLLNASAVVTSFRDAVPISNRFFARPVEDNKAFAGKVFEAGEFLDWQRDFLKEGNAFITMSADELVMLAPLQNIYAEYRLYVISGEIVTGSRYRLGGKVFYTTDLDSEMLKYARERIAEYCPRRALCLDIAHVEGPNPYKVIETNALSSSGFYACDMGKFVGAINAEFDQ